MRTAPDFDAEVLYYALVRPVIHGPEMDDRIADRDRNCSVNDESHDSKRPWFITILACHRAHFIAAAHEK